jgi:hypothetical protein
LNRWQQQSHEQTNDPDDDQQFDEREAATADRRGPSMAGWSAMR